MPKLSKRPPKYCLHKRSGHARVWIGGKEVFLGEYGSPESQERYAEVVAEWKASLEPEPLTPEAAFDALAKRVTVASLRERKKAGHPLTVNELVIVSVKHARDYYRKNDKVTREGEQIQEVLGFLRKHHGRLPVEEFGPVLLKDLREQMLEENDWSRKHLNSQVARIVRCFKWAAEDELVSPNVCLALKQVSGLKRGRSKARETKGVPVVADAVVDATLLHLPEVVADLVRFQRLTGARPGEVCTIRPCDIDRSSEVWVYQPDDHKTEHYEKDRLVMIGPKGQAILAPYLLRDVGSFCFTPGDSERKRYEALAASRKSSRYRARDRAKKWQAREYAPRYTADTYRHAVQRVCKRRAIEKWSPNQLRHTRATEIRKQFGLEAAQVVCGHENADITQVYAERDYKLASEVALKSG